MRKFICALFATACLSLPLAAEKKAVNPPEFAPAPGAPAPMFSQSILVDGTLYISGLIGQDLKTKELPADFEAEVKQVLDNIGIVLKAAGMTYKDVVAVQIYLTDIDLFAKMNGVYGKVFTEPRPSRTTVGVTKLANARARIEVTVTARK
jgi:2-iminobutanoate/2-iminopropanoate deaminase